MSDALSRRDWLRITAVAGVGVGFGAPLTLKAIESLGLRHVRQSRTQMGTVVTLTVVHPDGAHAHASVEAAFEEMERLEGILSRYRSTSAVGRLNRLGAIDAPPPELLDVLDAARLVHQATGGAFDVTVGPYVEAYAAAARAGATQPRPNVLADAAGRVGMDKLEVTEERVSYMAPEMTLTLDGVAKGYIVDRARSVLVDGGLDRVMVNAGGDVSAHDGVGREPWSVGVQDPRGADEILRVVRLSSESMATSSLPMRAFVHDQGPRIVDPRTGRLAEQVASVSVVSESAMFADALSTGLMVLGPEAALGPGHVDLPHWEALFVRPDGREVRTPGFV